MCVFLYEAVIGVFTDNSMHGEHCSYKKESCCLGDGGRSEGDNDSSSTTSEPHAALTKSPSSRTESFINHEN